MTTTQKDQRLRSGLVGKVRRDCSAACHGSKPLAEQHESRAEGVVGSCGSSGEEEPVARGSWIYPG